MTPPIRLITGVLLISCALQRGNAQNNATANAAATNVAQPATSSEPKRLFGIIPNYRTSETLHPYTPISAKQKFHLAAQDSFDPGPVILAAIVAGIDQGTNADKSYGQGVQAYAKYWGAEYATFVIGNYMTEAVLPSVLHQDPRYFRMGCCGWKRVGYALGQIVWTHSDSGKGQFNFSEIVGNSIASGASMGFFPNNRTAGDFASSLGIQLGVDAGVNVLKEFWPEVNRAFSRMHESRTKRQ